MRLLQLNRFANGIFRSNTFVRRNVSQNLHHTSALQIRRSSGSAIGDGTEPSPSSAKSNKPNIDNRSNILTIALVGRPNVGKSTLFNRLTNTRSAIVSNIPGTTRDRREGKGSLVGLPLKVIDTGGLDDRGQVSQQIQHQVLMSLESADVIAFLVDCKDGVTSLDNHFAQWLRLNAGKAAKSITSIDSTETFNSEVVSNSKFVPPSIIVVANKAESGYDSPKIINTISEASRFGFGNPIPISASHGDGLSDLFQSLLHVAKERGLEQDTSITYSNSKGNDNDNFDHNAAKIPLVPQTIASKHANKIPYNERTIQLAVMGKPNVGKSTFINSLLQSDRLIAGPTPGLTRDSIHIDWMFKDRQFVLVDTAGLTKITVDSRQINSAEEMRRTREMEAAGKAVERLPGVQFMDPEVDPSQFSSHISQLALISALNALKYSQVVVMMVESEQGNFSAVDLQLARKCMEEGRGLVIAANKADVVFKKGVSPTKYEEGVREHCEAFINEFGDIPVISCTASSGHGIHRVLAAVIRTHDAWSKRIETWVLNKWLKELLVTAPIPRHAGKRLNVKYITQVKTRPPVFALFCNAEDIPTSFSRYLRSKIQQEFQLEGVPIRFVIRKSEGNEVKTELLRQGRQTRRGVGGGSARPVGPKRELGGTLAKFRNEREESRRRESRIKRKRS